MTTKFLLLTIATVIIAASVTAQKKEVATSVMAANAINITPKNFTETYTNNSLSLKVDPLWRPKANENLMLSVDKRDLNFPLYSKGVRVSHFSIFVGNTKTASTTEKVKQDELKQIIYAMKPIGGTDKTTDEQYLKKAVFTEEKFTTNSGIIGNLLLADSYMDGPGEGQFQSIFYFPAKDKGFFSIVTLRFRGYHVDENNFAMESNHFTTSAEESSIYAAFSKSILATLELEGYLAPNTKKPGTANTPAGATPNIPKPVVTNAPKPTTTTNTPHPAKAVSHTVKTYENKGEYNEGVASVNTNKKYGFIDENGYEIVPLLYDDAYPNFKEGLAGVKLNKKWGFVDKTGNLVVACIYDDLYNFWDGLAGVKLNGKWGFIDRQGNIVIPIEYEDVKVFRNGYGKVQLLGVWWTVDKIGKLTVD